MRSVLSLLTVLGLLVLGGCSDEEDSPTGPGATGAQDVSTGGFMTAKQFIDASIPDQAEEVKTIVGVTPECQGVEAKPGSDFQVGVAITAAQSRPSTPLEEIVADQCSGG